MRTSLLLVLLLLLVACSDAADSGTLASNARQDTAADARPPAPDVVGTSLDGEQIDLSTLRGPVVVNFWASWCGPCISEAPHLSAISREYADRGAHVIGVNLDTSETNARTFQRDHELPFPSIHDPSKEIAAAFGRSGPAGLPTTIVLDAEHRVASRMLGAVTARELAPRLDALLEDGEAAAAPAPVRPSAPAASG